MTLLAAFSFDETTGDVLDHSGNGRDWTLNNGAIRSATGHTLGGLTKNGTSMPVVASPSYVGSSVWSFMFWRRGLGNAVWWLRLYNSAADTGSGILDTGGGSLFRLRLRTTSGNVETTTISAPGDGLWHHYAGTYDGANGRLYIDGVLVGTTGTATAPLAGVDRIDMMEFSLDDAFVDDLRFYDETLDQATIESLMNTPVVADAGLEIAPSGIASVEAFGTPVLSASVTVSPSSIASL